MKKRVLLTGLMVVVLTLLVFPTMVNGAVSVDPVHNITSGYDFTSIQSAIDDANTSNGDTIVIDPGTYVENVDVTKELTIQSQSGYTTTIVQASASNDHVFHVSADNVTIRGFSVYGALQGNTNIGGIYLGGVTGCTIENNRCGWQEDSTNYSNYKGIWLNGSNSNIIENNICNYNSYDGIDLGDSGSSSDNTISGNSCSYNDGAGIFLRSGSNYNTITGNTCTNNDSTGITMANCHYNFINGNESNNNAGGVTLNGSYNNVISDNECNFNDVNGINLSNCYTNYNTVAGNTCNLNSTNGIHIFNSSSNAIVGNAIDGSLRRNMYVTFSSNGNIIYMNDFSSGTFEGTTIASSIWNSPTELSYFHSPSHQGLMGNYYVGYSGTDGNGDGIGDSSYSPGAGTADNYPLMDTHDAYAVQVWYFNGDGTMYKADAGTAPGTVSINGVGGAAVWVSDKTAGASGYSFPSGTWTGQVRFDSSATGGNFTVEIGYADPDGVNLAPDPFTGPTANLVGSTNIFTYTTSDMPVSVPAGKCLAVRITNSGGAESVVTGGAWTYVSAPAGADTQWPVPEIATIILLSLGLLSLGGFIWFKKRRQVPEAA